jgi:hypothetical protein
VRTEPDTTLAWAEFLWQVAKEAPEVFFAYIFLLDYVTRRYGRQPRTVDLGRIEVESTSEIRAMLKIATEADWALPVRVTKRITLGVATEASTALPLRPA